MTPFDEYTTNHSLLITKLLVPLLPPKTQRPMAILIKFMELRDTLSSFHSMKQSSTSTDDILNSLKPYMNSSDLESFDQMMNMMNMMSMMQEMQNMSDENFDPTSMFMGMFAQDDHTEPEKEGEAIDGLDERSETAKYGSDEIGID